MKVWLEAIRAHQWSKNLLIFVPLILGHAIFDLGRVVAAGLSFVLLCALASASYIINDFADLESDRQHPLKRYRPFASGRLSIKTGLVIASLTILLSLTAAAFLALNFAIVLLGYLVLTVCYSFYFKRVALLDVFTIGFLFTTRIIMGSEASSLGHSPWLLSYSMFFFFSLALAKRHVEIMSARQRGEGTVIGRGYHADDWPLTLTFGIGAGLTSIVIMLLYLANEAAPSGFYRNIAWLYVEPVVVTLWLLRIWLLSNRMLLDNDPVEFSLTDKTSWALGLFVILAIILAV